MSNQNILSNLLVELSIEEQQLLTGGYRGDKDDRDDGYGGGYKPKKSGRNRKKKKYGSWYGR
ncbi:hypothetical protein FJR11_10435 [Anabaena sp. UHCC 0187]|uniref:hypothetical protein n=1 Tax=Anabaena sp. UHCC 0187 TaxID=2590018 RepID=UPI0014457734|nr:hypothetical protein [Anabaena sp. UHCC 0187]MTJ13000.1 hypothetical protein [Anabaena sp. UHCC 0187]